MKIEKHWKVHNPRHCWLWRFNSWLSQRRSETALPSCILSWILSCFRGCMFRSHISYFLVASYTVRQTCGQVAGQETCLRVVLVVLSCVVCWQSTFTGTCQLCAELTLPLCAPQFNCHVFDAMILQVRNSKHGTASAGKAPIMKSVILSTSYKSECYDCLW